MNFTPYYLSLIGLSFLASLSIYFFKNTGFLKYFPPFLLITFVVELFGFILAKKNIYNGLLYNVFSIIEVPFFLLYIRSVTRSLQTKIIIVFCIGAYILVKLADLFLLRANVFHFIPYNLGAVMIIVFCSWFFYENSGARRQSDRANISDLLICFTLIVFFGGSLPIYILFEVHKLPSVSFLITCRDILHILNIFMYAVFLLAFILRLWSRNRAVLKT